MDGRLWQLSTLTMTAPRAGRPPASPPVVTRVWGGPAPPAQHSHITAGKWAAAVEQGGFKPRRFETMWAPGENSSEGVVVGFFWCDEGTWLRPEIAPGLGTTGMQVKSALTPQSSRFSLFSLDNSIPTEQGGNSCVELGMCIGSKRDGYCH